MSGDKDWLFRLQDMVDHANKLQDALKGKTKDEYLNDELLQRVAERYFEIIGEAARHVPRDIQVKYDSIDWSEIIGMRHKISHDYLYVSQDVIWETARVKLEPLKKDLTLIIQKEDN